MVDLWDHQWKAVEYLRSRSNGLLMLGVGTGKTRTTLEFLHEKSYSRVLIVGTKNGASVWLNEVVKSGIPVSIKEYVTGTIRDRALSLLAASRSLSTGVTAIVVSYEAFSRKFMLDQLLKIRWDAIVFDEVHRLRNHGTHQSKYAYKLATKNPQAYRIGLTGTIIYNNPLDVFGVFRFVDPTVFGTNWEAFKYRYAVWKGQFNQIPVAYINQDELRDKVTRNSFIVDRHIVLSLPPETHTTRYADFTASEAKQYKALDKEYLSLINDKTVVAGTILDKVNKLQQMTSGFIYHENAVIDFSTAKESVLEDLLDEIGDEDVVIFYKFTEELKKISILASRMARPLFSIGGSGSDYAAWNLYRDRSSVLAVQISSGAESLDFTKASIVIFYSMIYTYGQYEQALGRVSRGNQTADKVSYYYLVVRNSIDEKIMGALQKGKSLVDYILSGEE